MRGRYGVPLLLGAWIALICGVWQGSKAVAQTAPPLNVSGAQVVRLALDYTAARFVALGEAPEVVVSHPVLASELPELGLIDSRWPDNEPPLYLVIVRGDFGLNPWISRDAYQRNDPMLAGSRARYLAYVMDLQAGRPLQWTASRLGGALRSALNDPTLPDDTLAGPRGLVSVPPPWTTSGPGRSLVPQPAARRVTATGMPCDQPSFPGASSCGDVPPCDAAGPVIGSCGIAGPQLCSSRGFAVVPDVCGRSSPTHYVEIRLHDDGFWPPELTIPEGTEVLWINGPRDKMCCCTLHSR